MKSWPWLFAGMAVGVINILFLKASVERFGAWAGDSGWLWFGLGMAARLALVIGIMLLAVHQGFYKVLFVFMGFTLVRWPLLYWLNKRAKQD